MKAWIKPVSLVQEFVTNDYVAACDTLGFPCDATPAVGLVVCEELRGTDVGSEYSAYKDFGNGDSWALGRPTGCGGIEIISKDTKLYFGWGDTNGDFKHNDGDTDVFIWLERDADGTLINAHCTANINITTWEATKS